MNLSTRSLWVRSLTAGILLAHSAYVPARPAAAGQPSAVPAAARRIALLDSANTKEFFRRHYPACSSPTSFYLGADEYQRYFRGWEFVLQGVPLAYDIIQDDDVTGGVLAQYPLAQYGVLILSNTVSLSDAETKSIASWVRGGGRMVATFGAGYKDILTDLREADSLKLQEGGTGGLHALWHDPLSKLFSSLALDPGVDIRMDSYTGPTACLRGRLADDTLPYGSQGNLLIQRPLQQDDVLASLVIDNPAWKKRQPAVIVSSAARGLVVYFAFAPEYLVSKEFGLPAPDPCPDGQNWAGRSYAGMALMQGTLQYLLTN